MTTGTIVASLVVFGIGSGWMPTRGRAFDAAAHVQAVDERFAVKFCYRQYTNQTDVAHCLLRNVRF